MSTSSVADLVRASLSAFVRKDREGFEALLGEGFTFSSPDDPRLDRAGYFERCWPQSERVRSLEIERLATDGNEAFVLYRAHFEGTPPFRNTEHVITRRGKIVRVEVYYGMPVDQAAG